MPSLKLLSVGLYILGPLNFGQLSIEGVVSSVSAQVSWDSKLPPCRQESSCFLKEYTGTCLPSDSQALSALSMGHPHMKHILCGCMCKQVTTNGSGDLWACHELIGRFTRHRPCTQSQVIGLQATVPALLISVSVISYPGDSVYL